jgi:hypothetical protein
MKNNLKKQHPEDLVASLSGTFVHTAAVVEGVLRTTMYICNCFLHSDYLTQLVQRQRLEVATALHNDGPVLADKLGVSAHFTLLDSYDNDALLSLG